jgi:UrcA family protein
MKAISTAIIAACLLGGATAATATEREPVALQVRAEGVNFADPAAVAALRREIERKIEVACNPGDRIGADMMPDFRCRREMAAALEPTLTTLAMRATTRNLATTD